MPRFHRVFDAQTGTLSDTQFTLEEETRRDGEEATALAQDTIKEGELQLRNDLKTKLTDDTITAKELRQLLKNELT